MNEVLIQVRCEGDVNTFVTITYEDGSVEEFESIDGSWNATKAALFLCKLYEEYTMIAFHHRGLDPYSDTIECAFTAQGIIGCKVNNVAV